MLKYFIFILVFIINFNLFSKDNNKNLDNYVKTIKKAENYFEYGKYKESIAIFLTSLKNKKMLNKELLLRTYQKLSLSYFYLEDKKNSEFYIKKIFNLDYNYKFDPIFIPPDFIEFSNEIFKKNKKYFLETKKFVNKLHKIKHPYKENLKSKLLYKNFIPGLGQFQNKHYYKGSMIIISESFFALASVISYGILKHYQKNDYTFEHTSLAEFGQVVNIISFISFFVVYGYSTIDSLVYYNASKVEVIKYTNYFPDKINFQVKAYVSYKLNF